MRLLRNFAIFAVLLFVGLLIFVHIWMSVFVWLLGYDYVTVSSVLFVFLVTVITIQTFVSILPWKHISTVAFAAVYTLVLYPLAFSSALRVYESWRHPSFNSDVINVVAMYRGMVDVPLSVAQSGISMLGPAYAATINAIESSSLLTQIFAATSVAMIQAIFYRVRSAGLNARVNTVETGTTPVG